MVVSGDAATGSGSTGPVCVLGVVEGVEHEELDDADHVGVVSGLAAAGDVPT